MSDHSRARHFLEEAKSRLRAGHPKKAVSVAAKGLDALGPGDASDPEHRSLVVALGELMATACEQANKTAVLRKRLPELFAGGLRQGPVAEGWMRSLVFEDKRTDHDAIGIYISYLEAKGALPDDLRERLNQVLSYALHVRLSTPVDVAAGLVPHLERLHGARPNLTFPRLYLGRYHYLSRNYAVAAKLLIGIQGRLASSPKVLNVSGRCVEKLGRADEALALYRSSLDADHHQPHVHFRIGRLLFQRYRRAIGLDSSLYPEPPSTP